MVQQSGAKRVCAVWRAITDTRAGIQNRSEERRVTNSKRRMPITKTKTHRQGELAALLARFRS